MSRPSSPRPTRLRPKYYGQVHMSCLETEACAVLKTADRGKSNQIHQRLDRRKAKDALLDPNKAKRQVWWPTKSILLLQNQTASHQGKEYSVRRLYLFLTRFLPIIKGVRYEISIQLRMQSSVKCLPRRTANAGIRAVYRRWRQMMTADGRQIF